jgi:N-ethylmaleimide reductase
MSNQPLFTPYRMGDLDLPNRIVMAPLTRMRAQPHDHVPTTLQAEYYAQRTSAGLIIAEATAISPDGFGQASVPLVVCPLHHRGGKLFHRRSPISPVLRARR